MAGLGAFLLAGALGGAGEALQNSAKEAKERAAARAKTRREQQEKDDRARRDSDIYREVYAPTASAGRMDVPGQGIPGRENLGATSPLWGQANTGDQALGFGNLVTPEEGAPAAPGDETFVSDQQPPKRMGFGEVLDMRPTGSSDSALPAWLVASESGGRLSAKNDVPGSGGVGHFGRGQFSQGRLAEAKAAGVIPKDMTPQQFLTSAEGQAAVEAWHVDDIQRFIQSEGLDSFIGQRVNGQPVTLSGMIGVAHLGGSNGLKRHLESGGRYNPSDAYGTSLSDYMGRGAQSPDLGSGTGEVTSGDVTLSAPPSRAADPAAPDAARIERLIRMATDQDASSEARAAAKKELEQIAPASGGGGSGTSIPAPGASSLASEIWWDNGDGTETLYGRTSGGNTLEPYLKDGKPVTRNRDEVDRTARKPDWQLGSSDRNEIEDKMERDAKRWDQPPRLDDMQKEVERLMKLRGDLTFLQAYDLAADAWQGDDNTVETADPTLADRFIPGVQSGRTKIEPAPIYAFRYGDDGLKPRATDPGMADVLATPAPGPYRAAEPPIRPERMGLGVATGRTGPLGGLAPGTQTTVPAAPVLPTAPVATSPSISGADRRGLTQTPEFAQAIRSIPPQATPARDARFVEMTRAGYASPLSTTMAPVQITEKLPEGVQSITFQVGVMPVAFGDGRQDIVMPASYDLGRATVTQLGGVLPTRGIVDAMYAQGNRVIVQPQGASADMTSMAAAARHTRAVYDKLPGDLSRPVVGPFKEILADGHYYGLWKQNGSPWQPYTDLRVPHSLSYSDYSQAARLVGPKAVITFADGRRVEMDTAVIYRTQAYREALGLKGQVGS